MANKPLPVEEPASDAGEPVLEASKWLTMSDEEIGAIIRRTIDRKRKELERAESKAKADPEFTDWLRKDIASYAALFSEFTGIEADEDALRLFEDGPSMFYGTERHAAYVSKLSKRAAADERAADELRMGILEEIYGDIAYGVGMDALSDKKTLKLLMEDEYAVSEIGKIIMEDEFLMALFDKAASSKQGKKKDKKKKDK
ncbi:MAG: hypothetical protein LBG62_04750 [Candidatus Methanoplasma sp.]|jgi:hypothetical protein|nr:hypothetical protein [Candidatus Methanoplasma sp.]